MNEHNKKVQRSFRRMFLIIAAVLLVVGLFALAFWDERRYRVGTTTDQITDNQSEYINKVVTVAGEVNSIITPRIFTIGGEDFLGNKEILVLSDRPLPPVADRPIEKVLIEDDVLLVRGKVQKFDVKQAERQLQKTLDPDLFTEFVGKPVIFARHIAISPRIDRDDLAVLPPDPITDVATIVTIPLKEFLIGKRTELSDVSVTHVVGDRAFWVGTDKEKTFVVLSEQADTPDQRLKIEEGQRLAVSGVIKEVPNLEEAKKQWNLNAEDVKILRDQKLYLTAERVEILE